MTFDAVVVDAPTPGCSNMLVDNAPDDDAVVGLERAEILVGRPRRPPATECDPCWALECGSLGVTGSRTRSSSSAWASTSLRLSSRTGLPSMPPAVGFLGLDERLLEAPGAPCYQLREQAMAALRERGYGALRTLLWGRHCAGSRGAGTGGSVTAGTGVGVGPITRQETPASPVQEREP